MQTLGDCSKIAGPEAGHEFILHTRLTGWDKCLKANEGLMPAETERFIVIKIFGRKRDIPKTIFLDLLKQHAPLEVIARMEKAETIRRITPDRALRQETNPAVEIVVQVLQIR